MTPGTRFAYLVVVRESTRTSNYGRRYLCVCACGRETTQRAEDLRSGKVQSCGCVGALARAAYRNSARIRAEHVRRQEARGVDPAAIAALHYLGRAA